MRVRAFLTLMLFPMLTSPVLCQETGRKYMGVRECDGCHGGGAIQYPNLVNSWQIWAQDDKHSRAYSDLVEKPLSKHIAGWMGLPLDQPATWKKCTVCHMADPPKERWGEKFDPTTEGVGCEACHGPAEDYLIPHKSQTYQQNLEVGLYDLKDLRTRARLCLDCHTGLDHEIVAAGHPDLNFELFHFSFWQPPHWNYAEASPFKFWAIGQAAALEKTVADLARDSNLYQPMPVFQDKSCYNCHHKLDQDRWRQVEAHQTVMRPLVKNLLGEDRARKMDEDLNRIRLFALDNLPAEDRTANLKSLGQRLTAGLVDDVSHALKTRGIDADFVRSLLLDLIQPVPSTKEGLKPHLPVAWMVENFNDAEQVYLGIYSMIYAIRYYEAPEKTTKNMASWVTEQASEEGLLAAVDQLFEFVKHSKVANRNESFRAEGFNQALEKVRDESSR